MADGPIEILLVEDSPADVRLTLEALREVGAGNRLTVANDGLEAMRVLKDRVGRRAPLPEVILLDLNLPRMDGREVLEAIKTSDALKHIPVIVLTTSRAEQDVVRSYALGANAFVIKSANLDEFVDKIRAFAKFWLDAARL